jgi:single-stranded DNA-binding protein
METNKIEFTGTIERLQPIQTKTGSQMARWFLKVGQDRFGCVAFGNVAENLLACGEGDEISITGTGKINSWKTEDGNWRNDFQVSAWSCEINGQTIKYEKNTGNGSQTLNSRDDSPPLPPEPNQRDEFDHSGGPF